MSTIQHKRIPPANIPGDGQWHAWDHNETHIVATGRTVIEAKTAAEEAGEPKPVLVKAPSVDVRLAPSQRYETSPFDVFA